MNKKLLRLLGAVTVLALCLASCGGRGSTDGGTDAATVETGDSVVTSDMAGDGTPETYGDAGGGAFSAPVSNGIPASVSHALTGKETDLVAHLVAAEAGDEPYMTQVVAHKCCARVVDSGI